MANPFSGDAYVRNYIVTAEPVTPGAGEADCASRVILHNTGEAAGTAEVNSQTITVGPGAVITLDNNGGRTYALGTLTGVGMQATIIA